MDLADKPKIRTEEEIYAAINHHAAMIAMQGRILQLYKTPGLSYAQIRELEAQIMREYN